MFDMINNITMFCWNFGRGENYNITVMGDDRGFFSYTVGMSYYDSIVYTAAGKKTRRKLYK